MAAGAVIEQQQNAGDHLDGEEKQRDAAEVVPHGGGMHGHGLVRQRFADGMQAEPFFEPARRLCFAVRLLLDKWQILLTRAAK